MTMWGMQHVLLPSPRYTWLNAPAETARAARSRMHGLREGTVPGTHEHVGGEVEVSIAQVC